MGPTCLWLVFAVMAMAASTPMRVIGAGFSRASTSSLGRALDRLGYSTYHMERLVFRGHLRAWGRVYLDDGGTNNTALGEVLDLIAQDGFDAGVGFPISLAFAELVARHPTAVVILSLHDSADEWATSYEKTIGRLPLLAYRPPFSWFVPDMAPLVEWIAERSRLNPLSFEPRHGASKTAYGLWVDEVRKQVPATKLFEFRSSDEWSPLCKFLSVQEGQCPEELGEVYPLDSIDSFDAASVNVVEFFTDNWSYLWPLLAIALLWASLWVVLRCWRFCRPALPAKEKVS